MLPRAFDRRAFLKAIGATALVAALPFEMAAITFTEVHIDERILGHYLRIGNFRREGDHAVVDVMIDAADMWRAVSLHDALKASESDVYAIPRITPDGKYLFFEKYDSETDRSDIYWVSTAVIKHLEPATQPNPVAAGPIPAWPPIRGD